MDIFAYKKQLEAKLAAVNNVITDMGSDAPARRGRPAGAKAAPAPKAKRKMSAAGRAAIRAAVKARWAAVKKAGKSRLT